VKTTADAPPMEISRDQPLVVAARRAISEVLHEDRNVRGFPAVSDASNFVSAGVPAVIIGPGNLNMAHKPDEYVPVDEVTNAARIYAATALRLLT